MVGSRGQFFSIVSLTALASAAVGCQQRDRAPSGTERASAALAPSAPVAAGGGAPIPDAELDRVYTAHRGLLRGLKPDALPFVSGPEMDPLIETARRYYAAVETPFAAAGEGQKSSATLDDWKRAFGFDPPRAGETRQAFRDRTGAVVYYNRNELGLGRELGCARFTDVDPRGGRSYRGIACFVTNYGHGFRDGASSLEMAVQGDWPRNTVCILYRPALGAGYEVQFYVFGPTGARQEWAQLDTLGPRPHPLVCMNCHGGNYDEDRNLARNARFLPLDPSLVDFMADGGADLTRAGQEERIRVINEMATETPLTPAQRDIVQGLYDGRVHQPQQRAVTGWVPEPWRHAPADYDFYDAVVKPYCATCHAAVQLGSSGEGTLWSYRVFQTPTSFDRASLGDYICDDFSMPNAQPTIQGFWDTGRPVTVAGRRFGSAADAFLARNQTDRTTCANLTATVRCDRGGDPDSLCGDGANGVVCDRARGGA